MSQQDIDVVRASIEAYNRRDLDALGRLNRPDLEVDWSASVGLEARVYRGLDEVMRFYRNFLETFEQVTVLPDRFIDGEGSVVVPNAAEMHGRDGIKTVAHSTLVFELRDGRIARIRLFQETEAALEAAGLSE
jgi:ketosteroid isomerase-like protein